MTACDWKYAQYPTILLLFMLTVERYCLVAGIDNVILFVSFIVVHLGLYLPRPTAKFSIKYSSTSVEKQPSVACSCN